ncbi:MAG: sulfatase [Acidobacteriota bacterium]
MKRRNLLIPILAMLWVFAADLNAAESSRPNILFIMSDDHAAHAISAYGSRINKTPHLDRLASEGMRFERSFAVNSICTPSRATILTGKYSHKNGVPVFNAFDGSQPHVARQLQAAGYYTGIIGKWHLGTDPTGFSHWEILPGQGRYFDPILYDRDGARVYPGYVTEVLTDLALSFLEKRPADQPFFLMLHHKAPHREWSPNLKYREEFSKRKIPEAHTLYDTCATRTEALREQQQSVFYDLTRRDLKLVPPSELKGAELQQWLSVKPTEVTIQKDGKSQTLTGEALNKWKYQRYLQDYLACVQSVDDSVGRVVAWLDEHGLRENTVVIYTSDQGFFLGDHGLYDKRFMYEESIRMPLLVRWPAGIKPRLVNRELVINCDFAPTLVELAGARPLAGVQGRSLLPLFREQRPADWRQSFYYRYYHDPGHHNTRAHYGIRTGRHKLIYYWKKDQWEFFDLDQDPEELRNLYYDARTETVVAELKRELNRLRAELEDDDAFSEALPSYGVDGPPLKWKPGHGPE